MAIESPLTIKEFVEHTDLRSVQWNQRYLEKTKAHYKLTHGQAVVFSNKRETKFRLVCCFYGMAVLLLTPVDNDEKISLYLKIAAFLRKFNGSQRVLKRIDVEIESAQERLVVQKDKALRARAKMKKTRRAA